MNNNKLKVAVAAFGFALTCSSSLTFADMTLPIYDDKACVADYYHYYCRSINKPDNCTIYKYQYDQWVVNCRT